MIDRLLMIPLALFLISQCAISQTETDSALLHRYGDTVQRLLETGLREGRSFQMLEELTRIAGHRLSGSEGAERAVEITRNLMLGFGFDNVHTEHVMVPRWVRGNVEECLLVDSKNHRVIPLSVCALGGSIATPSGGIEAGVIEVKSFEELASIGEAARGKVVLFNRPFDPAKLNAFESYVGAVDQRSRGAIEAAKAGAVAALVRSMTHAADDVPHTGMMNYDDTIPRIPAAAVSTHDADSLGSLLRAGQSVTVRLTLACQTLPDVSSSNVIGEIRGSEHPEEIIVVGGHLDAWDKGSGAHDDGAGCVQAIEVVRLIKSLGLKPKRTIRAVMFMNEENGTRGGKAYPQASERAGEVHIAAIESDRGGFAPRGISVHDDSVALQKVKGWRVLFERLNAGTIQMGYGGVDISPLREKGTRAFGLDVETHRYFDYHHSENDTIDKVNPRELEMGAIVEALFCYLVSEEGL